MADQDKQIIRSPLENSLIEVSAGVIFRHGQLLITQRRPQDHLGGLWEFPGGKRQAGESGEDCLRRELTEELAIEVEVKELIETITHQYPEKAVRLKFFPDVWLVLRHEPQASWLPCSGVGRRQSIGGLQSFPAADVQLLAKLR